MSFLEIGGLFGSVASGYVTDKLVRKVGRKFLCQYLFMNLRVQGCGRKGPCKYTCFYLRMSNFGAEAEAEFSNFFLQFQSENVLRMFLTYML